MSSLFESFLATPQVTQALSDRAVIEAMLRVEAALARAHSRVGLLPQAVAQSIIDTCKVELFDVPKLVRESAQCRSLATPLVNALRDTVALFNPQAAGLVHLGCTDQELVDTALALVTRQVLTDIEADLAQTVHALLTLAATHADAALLARPPQPLAAITTFGLACSQWVAPLVRSQQRLRWAADGALCLRLGGDPFSRAAWHNQDAQRMALMAAELELGVPAVSGDVSHDETVALACALGVLAGGLGSMAADIAHMAQPEVGELAQSAAAVAPVPGAKPVALEPMATLCLSALATAQQIPQQVATLLATLSRPSGTAVGQWQAQVAQWPALLSASQTLTQAVAHLVRGLQVDTPRMRRNLDAVRASLPAKEAKARLSPELVQQACALTHTQIAALQTLHVVAP